MEAKKGGARGETGGSTRRGFLKGAAALAAGAPAVARAAGEGPGATGTARTSAAAEGGASPADGRLLAYVGTYSSPEGPEGSPGLGEGIYLMEMNPESGELTQRELFANGMNPSWLALDPSKKYLYSGNETSSYRGVRTGSVSAYRIEGASGRLTLLNTVPSGAAGPAHVSVHPSGKFVLAANYAGGAVAVLPVKGNGKLGRASSTHRDEGEPGPAHATSAPRGSFAISGHEAPHAHMIESDPAGGRVVWSDLGLDRIFVAKIDLEKGTLGQPGSAGLGPGDGPRHFIFHPNGRWMYSLQEEASTLVLWDYNAGSGELQARQTLSTLPPGFAGTNFTSEVRIAPGARFLYAANRLRDTIAFFSIESDGRLAYAGEEWTRGDYPRSFTIDPTGNFLFSCNQRSDAVTTFRVNRQTGALTFTGQYTPVGTPAVVVFLA